jgi:hypothetical protein
MIFQSLDYLVFLTAVFLADGGCDLVVEAFYGLVVGKHSGVPGWVLESAAF